MFFTIYEKRVCGKQKVLSSSAVETLMSAGEKEKTSALFPGPFCEQRTCWMRARPVEQLESVFNAIAK